MRLPRCWWLLTAVLLCACPRNEPQLATPLDEDPDGAPPPLLASINMADPRASEQLLEGFHALEGGAWRWTRKSFSVILAVPPPVPLHKTAVELRFTLPQVVVDRAGPVTLTAIAGGHDLGPETYAEAGEGLSYRRAVPEEALDAETLRVDFELDKAMGPDERDPRELGVIVLAVALK